MHYLHYLQLLLISYFYEQLNCTLAPFHEWTAQRMHSAYQPTRQYASSFNEWMWKMSFCWTLVFPLSLLLRLQGDAFILQTTMSLLRCPCCWMHFCGGGGGEANTIQCKHLYSCYNKNIINDSNNLCLRRHSQGKKERTAMETNGNREELNIVQGETANI